MTMTIPVIPQLPAGYVVQAADLQNLASACSFLLSKPIARVRSVSLGTALAVSPSRTNIPYDTIDFDPDGMWNAGTNTRLTVQTPGWYKVRYGVVCSSTSAVVDAAVAATSGPNNPGGAGVASANYWGSDSVGSTGSVHTSGCSGIWPFYLFAGDYLQVNAAVNSGGTDSLTTGSGDLATYFSLEYISIAQT